MATLQVPLDGSLPTLPDLADFHATYHRDAPWLMYPSKEQGGRPETISYGEMARASHRVAHILRPGRRGPEREVIALILNVDTVLYAAAMLGLMRAGFVVRTLPQAPPPKLKAILTALSHVSTKFSARRRAYAQCHFLSTHCFTRANSISSLSSQIRHGISRHCSPHRQSSRPIRRLSAASPCKISRRASCRNRALSHKFRAGRHAVSGTIPPFLWVYRTSEVHRLHV